MTKCKICNKRQKENTDDDNRYCQGHDMFSIKEKMLELGTKSNGGSDLYKLVMKQIKKDVEV